MMEPVEDRNEHARLFCSLSVSRSSLASPENLNDHAADDGSSRDRTVYNGEWAPQDGGAMDSRARLVTEVRRQCEQAGVGWAIWEDPNNMKLFDSAAGTWVESIIRSPAAVAARRHEFLATTGRGCAAIWEPSSERRNGSRSTLPSALLTEECR